MTPARSNRHGHAKLLVVKNGIEHSSSARLADYFNVADLLIVNRSATIPGSFRGVVERSGNEVEIRLAAYQGDDWLAFSFGTGCWRQPTEDRGPAPHIAAGDRILIGPDLVAEVLHSSHNRLLRIHFTSTNVARNLYQHGKPIQYSYLKEELEVWDQQTLFAGPPVSVEPPSASFPLTWELVMALKKKGVVVADIVHGAGISSTGSEELDRLLPLTEWFEIPQQTAALFKQAKARGAQIVAAGTTVLRAIESAWNGEGLNIGRGLTSLKITPEHKIQTATALITGIHDVGTSHMNILHSFCSANLLAEGYTQAENRGYQGHEFGDIALIACS